MKKKLIILLFFICINPVFCFDASILNGSWITEFDYFQYIKEKSLNKVKIHYADLSFGKLKSPWGECLIFDLLKNNNISNGVYYNLQINTSNIKVSKQPENKLLIKHFRDVDGKETLIGESIIEVVDIDKIKYSGFNFGSQDGFYYRFSGPSRIPPQNAILNDTRVRLRVKPNLSCDTWAFLDKGTKCIIKDKSAEPFIIDGESWYCYRVDAEGYPDGWVYGKYLDIEK